MNQFLKRNSENTKRNGKKNLWMKQFEKKYKKFKMKWKKIFGSDCILDKLRISYPKAVCQ